MLFGTRTYSNSSSLSFTSCTGFTAVFLSLLDPDPGLA